MRTLIFWVHLLVGSLLAVLVAPMACTGSLLSFEREITHWAERDLRGGGGPLLAPSALMTEVPGTISMLELYREPGAPVLILADRRPWLVDGSSGALLGESQVRVIFGVIQDVHRTAGLAFTGERELGTTLTGAAAIGMSLLAVSGLVLWWPKGRKGWRERLWLGAPHPTTTAKRDWRWHHVFGFWASWLVLLISSTGSVIAFSSISEAFGKAKPLAQPAAPTDLDGAMAQAMQLQPEWRALRVRLPSKEGKLQIRVRTGEGVRPTDYETLHFTPDSLARSPYERGEPGDRLRGWSRWLHTGQALGRPAQALWGLTALAVVVLVYTGLTMSWRRWQRWRRRRASSVARSTRPAPAP